MRPSVFINIYCTMLSVRDMYCPSCGVEVDNEVSYCSECGAEIGKEINTTGQQTTDTSPCQKCDESS